MWFFKKKNNKAEAIVPQFSDENMLDEGKMKMVAELSINLVMAAHRYFLLGTALHDERGYARAYYIHRLGIELITKVEALNNLSRQQAQSENSEMTFMLNESDSKEKVYNEIFNRKFSPHGRVLSVDQLLKAALMLNLALLSSNSTDLKDNLIAYHNSDDLESLRSSLMGELITLSGSRVNAQEMGEPSDEEGQELVDFKARKERAVLCGEIDSVTAFLNDKTINETKTPPACLLLDTPRTFQCERPVRHYNAFVRPSGRM